MSQAWEMEKTTEPWEEKGIPNPPPLKTNKGKNNQTNPISGAGRDFLWELGLPKEFESVVPPGIVAVDFVVMANLG